MRCSSEGATVGVVTIAAVAVMHFKRLQNFDLNYLFRYIHFPQGFAENHHLPKNPLVKLAVTLALTIRIAKLEPTISTKLIGLESCWPC